ncbi:hypothetical protein J6590_004184 [Homalodisca vitripennis]|nr:hypothetical protein J6590_004184 [Homalodisca vitripennis]
MVTAHSTVLINDPNITTVTITKSQATYTHFYRSLYPIAAQRLPHNLRSQLANLAGIILPEPVQKNSGW